MIPKKTTKMIVKDGNGDFLQLLPEAYTDSALNASSSDPISNAAATSALNATAERVAELSLFKVMDEEPTALNTQGTADKAIFAWLQPETPSWSITIDTEADGNEGEKMGQIPFCLYGVQNASIAVDWGDGTIEMYATANAVQNSCPTHQYATAGEYTIRMESDDFNRLYLWTNLFGEEGDPAIYVTTLKSIDEPLPQIAGLHKWWYNEGTEEEGIGNINNSFYGCFSGCSSLQSIPSGLFDNNTTVTDFSWCFNECSSLQSIPSGLFDNNTAVTSFVDCFDNCSSLQSIPSGLFDNNTAVTSFVDCFYKCTSLASIPSGLFDSNTAVTSFDWCFYGCSSIQSIPSGLFDSNTAVTSFDSCFSRCSSIQSIPSGLFDSNTAVTSFSACFYGCSSLTDFTFHIGSSLVSDCSDFVTKKTGTTRTIYVPNGSTTQTTFNAQASSLGLTVIGE
jgi:hypothetical protein